MTMNVIRLVSLYMAYPAAAQRVRFAESEAKPTPERRLYSTNCHPATEAWCKSQWVVQPELKKQYCGDEEAGDHCRNCSACDDTNEPAGAAASPLVTTPSPAVQGTTNEPSIDPTTLKPHELSPHVTFLVSGYNRGNVGRVSVSSTDAPASTIFTAGNHTNMSWFVKKGKHVYGTQESANWADRNDDLRTLIHMKENGDDWHIESVRISNHTGKGPAHIHEAQYNGDTTTTLYLSNYGGASLAVVPLAENGDLPDVEDIKKYDFTCGDKTSRPHQTVTKDDHVWVVDLGCNKIRHFTRNGEDGSLEENEGTDVPADREDSNTAYEATQIVKVHYNKPANEETNAPAWSDLAPCPPLHADILESEFLEDAEQTLEPKPRHMALHPTRDLAYVVLEGQPYVEVYDIVGSGALEFKQRVELTEEFGNDTCPPFQNLGEWSDASTTNLPYYGAEILVSPDGTFVYASARRSLDPSRGDAKGIITVYKVQDDGTLVKMQEYPLAGKWCRSMELTRDGSLLAVALQDKDTVQLLQLSDGKIIEDSEDSSRTVSVEGVTPAFITLEEN